MVRTCYWWCAARVGTRHTGDVEPVGSAPGSEGRLVVGRRAAAPAATLLAAGLLRGSLPAGGSGCPGVLLLLAATEAAALLAAASETGTAAPALGLVDLGRGVAQRGADLVDLHLDDRALLALLGLVRARLQAARDDHASAALQGLGDVLGCVAPHGAAHEQRLAVLPLVALPVERARRGGHGEVRDGSAGRGEAQLRVAGDVADDGDDGVASHEAVPLCRCGCSVRWAVRRRGAAAWCA